MVSFTIFAPLLFGHEIKCGAYGIEEERQYTYKRNIEGRSHNHCCRRKVISITYSESVSVV